MWFQNLELFVPETGKEVQLRGETISKQCVIRALACADMPRGGMLASKAALDKAANKAYEAIKREGDQCWAVFEGTPTTARCNFLQARLGCRIGSRVIGSDRPVTRCHGP